MHEYLAWFDEIGPNYFNVRDTVFHIGSEGAIHNTTSQLVGQLTMRQEEGEPVEGKEWYDQPVVWTALVKDVDGNIVYHKQKAGTASPYDGTRQELIAHGLDALRKAITDE